MRAIGKLSRAATVASTTEWRERKSGHHSESENRSYRTPTRGESLDRVDNVGQDLS
jgi:hypothetical protein